MPTPARDTSTQAYRDSLDAFTLAYLACALWSSLDDEEPMDKNHTMADLALETVDKMVEDCREFRGKAWDLIAEHPCRAGHDFWLTRNRHGAGFWDGDWPLAGLRLTQMAHAFGECDLYVGDDGKIYAT
jgi:hypothetical protein